MEVQPLHLSGFLVHHVETTGRDLERLAAFWLQAHPAGTHGVGALPGDAVPTIALGVDRPANRTLSDHRPHGVHADPRGESAAHDWPRMRLDGGQTEAESVTKLPRVDP